MFRSYFPQPIVFFPSVIAWAVVAVLVWYLGGSGWGEYLGLGKPTPEDALIVGIHYFWSPSFLWLYVYYVLAVVLFAAFWFRWSPHPWQVWSILGSAVILFATYYGVQVSVALNNWRRPFFDLVQAAFNPDSGITADEFYNLFWVFASIAFMAVFIFAATRFLVSHWIFRWRTAMNDYYMARWKQLRHIEGASQRVQEDTMRFAGIMEGLGISIVDAVMTLIAFLPLLWSLSGYVTELPLVGAVPAPLFTAVIFWSVFGTVMLAVVGIKLPGLEFRNQRVEAAYRKELVYGEDDEARAEPMTVRELFGYVRQNYFRLYFHYMYFNLFRSLYLQADNLFAYFLLVPTIIASTAVGFTYGIMQQVLTAFNQVSNSFQYLINAWPTIVELLSIYKRLKAFESAISGEELPDIDREWLELHGAGDDGSAKTVGSGV